MALSPAMNPKPSLPLDAKGRARMARLLLLHLPLLQVVQAASNPLQLLGPHQAPCNEPNLPAAFSRPSQSPSLQAGGPCPASSPSLSAPACGGHGVHQASHSVSQGFPNTRAQHQLAHPLAVSSAHSQKLKPSPRLPVTEASSNWTATCRDHSHDLLHHAQGARGTQGGPCSRPSHSPSSCRALGRPQPLALA